MMRTDSKGRSASPHRITYKSDFHAIKCSFDTGASLHPGTKAAAAAAAQRSAVHPKKLPSSLSDSIMYNTSSSTGNRGRILSARGTKIRDNIFLQMDSQQLRQDGSPALSSGSTPLLSPQIPSMQLQTSTGPKRSVISSSSVLSTVSSLSTPDPSLQGKPSRAEEIADIDRAALAQKFSVTRKLFETKMMEAGVVGGQASKPMIGKGSKSMADGNGEGNQMETAEEARGKRRCTHKDASDKDESINHFIHISSLKCPGEASDKSPSNQRTQDQTTGGKKATLDPCLTPEQMLRAELVNVKNESSESDDSEEEGKNWLQAEMETKVVVESVEALVDNVFEEPSMETALEHQKELSVGMRWKTETTDDGEGGEDKYQQVNEQWEGEREEQNRHFIAQAMKSQEEKNNRETNQRVIMQEEIVDKAVKGTEKCAEEECRQSQEEERTEKEEINEREETPDLQVEPGKEGIDSKGDQTKAAVICGIENKAFVYDQESQSHPELSASHTENQLLVEYEEIPGVPELDSSGDASEAARRKVKFSSDPIKVSVQEWKMLHSRRQMCL